MFMPMPKVPVPPSHVHPLTMFYALNLVIALLLLTIVGETVLWRWQHKTLHISRQPLSPRGLLAWGLGGLWLIDGLLQLQPLMATDFGRGYLTPLVHDQPQWLASVIRIGMYGWDLHPIVSDVVAAWLQISLGALILFGSQGRLRKLGLLASIVWGVVVWIFGEALGGLLAAPSWLIGSPGPALLYVALAVLLLQAASSPWWGPGSHHRWARAIAGFWALAGVLQVLPADGWWRPHALASYVHSMAAMPQPHLLSQLLEAWTGSLALYPQLWNAGLAAAWIGLAAYWAFGRPSRHGWWGTAAMTFAGWMFGQDFGVLGGLGTDANSGLLLLLVLVIYALNAGWFSLPSARALDTPALSRPHFWSQRPGRRPPESAGERRK